MPRAEGRGRRAEGGGRRAEDEGRESLRGAVDVSPIGSKKPKGAVTPDIFSATARPPGLRKPKGEHCVRYQARRARRGRLGW